LGSLPDSNASDLVTFAGLVPRVPVRRSTVPLRISDAFTIAPIAIGLSPPSVSAPVDLAAHRRLRVDPIDAATGPSIPEFTSIPVFTGATRHRPGPPDSSLAIVIIRDLGEATEQRLAHPRRHSIHLLGDSSGLFGCEAPCVRVTGWCVRTIEHRRSGLGRRRASFDRGRRGGEGSRRQGQ
jgi:hypothetical protein